MRRIPTRVPRASASSSHPSRRRWRFASACRRPARASSAAMGWRRPRSRRASDGEEPRGEAVEIDMPPFRGGRPAYAGITSPTPGGGGGLRRRHDPPCGVRISRTPRPDCPAAFPPCANGGGDGRSPRSGLGCHVVSHAPTDTGIASRTRPLGRQTKPSSILKFVKLVDSGCAGGRRGGSRRGLPRGSRWSAQGRDAVSGGLGARVHPRRPAHRRDQTGPCAISEGGLKRRLTTKPMRPPVQSRIEIARRWCPLTAASITSYVRSAERADRRAFEKNAGVYRCSRCPGESPQTPPRPVLRRPSTETAPRDDVEVPGKLRPAAFGAFGRGSAARWHCKCSSTTGGDPSADPVRAPRDHRGADISRFGGWRPIDNRDPGRRTSPPARNNLRLTSTKPGVMTARYGRRNRKAIRAKRDLAGSPVETTPGRCGPAARRRLKAITGTKRDEHEDKRTGFHDEDAGGDLPAGGPSG